MHSPTWLRATVVVTAIVSGGCITQPTLDVTKAPFRASTDLSEAPTRASSDLTDGTSDATTDLTQPTKEFTSSTSPRSWFSQDGILKPEYKLTAFTAFNVENLRDDVARGDGEYVTSLATLVGVPEGEHGRYLSSMQDRYPSLFAESRPAVESLVRAVSLPNSASR